MARKGYGRGKKCPGCGKPIGDRASKCKSCIRKSPNIGGGSPLLAWRYDCPCGIVAYSFDGTATIRDSVGHEIRRGSRVIYSEGKFHDFCPLCGLSADSHAGARGDERDGYAISCFEGSPDGVPVG